MKLLLDKALIYMVLKVMFVIEMLLQCKQDKMNNLITLSKLEQVDLK
jgi:hypothetical protein